MFTVWKLFMGSGAFLARPQVQGEVVEQACCFYLALYLRPRLFIFYQRRDNHLEP